MLASRPEGKAKAKSAQIGRPGSQLSLGDNPQAVTIDPVDATVAVLDAEPLPEATTQQDETPDDVQGRNDNDEDEVPDDVQDRNEDDVDEVPDDVQDRSEGDEDDESDGPLALLDAQGYVHESDHDEDQEEEEEQPDRPLDLNVPAGSVMMRAPRQGMR